MAELTGRQSQDRFPAFGVLGTSCIMGTRRIANKPEEGVTNLEGVIRSKIGAGAKEDPLPGGAETYTRLWP